MNVLDHIVAWWKGEHPGETLPDPRKGMERRTFLKILGASAGVAAAVDLEALIWTPKPIVVAPDMDAVLTYLTPEFIVKEALAMFERNLNLAILFDRAYEARHTRVVSNTYLIGQNGQIPRGIAREDFVRPMTNFVEQALTADMDHGREPTMTRSNGLTLAKARSLFGRVEVRAVSEKSLRTGLDLLRLEVQA